METMPTLRPNCQIIAGKTVCNFHGSLLLTQLLLNITSTVAPPIRGGVSPSVTQRTVRPSERPDRDSHVDLVDDLSSFFGSRSRSGGQVSPQLTITTGVPSSRRLTTSPSSRMYVTPMVFRGEKGDVGPPGPPGVCPQRCRLPDSELRVLPSDSPDSVGRMGDQGPPGAQGPKGDKGSLGAPGRDGAPGECRPDQCGRGPSASGEKGPKGDRGEAGARGASGPKGERGPRGDPGFLGEKGEPGGAADTGAVRDLVRSELQLLRQPTTSSSRTDGPKGAKGEPGACACGERAGPVATGRAAGGSGGGQALASTGVRVLGTYQVFRDISYAFEDGTLVFTKDEKILYLKTDYRLNQWIEVANYMAKPKIQLGFPSTTTSPRAGSQQPQIFLSHLVTGKKIRLIALPVKLHGDLYYKSASSILGADYACHDAAQAVGLTRSYFKVFLNGQFNNLDTVVHASQRADVPVVNYHGQKLFSSFSDMISRGVWNKEVQLQDFNGRNLSEWKEHYGRSEILAWQGLRQVQRQAHLFSQDCEGFTNRDPVKFGYVTDLKSGQLFQSREMTCDTQQIVLCIEAFDENSVITDPMDYRRRR